MPKRVTRLLAAVSATLATGIGPAPVRAGDLQKLTAADPLLHDHFGNAVSLCGDSALIGAWLEDARGRSAGAAYVFRREPGGEWVEEAKLLAEDGAANDHFGASVSLSDDVAIVGAADHDGIDLGTGAAYVFRRVPADGAGAAHAWVQEMKLTAADAERYDYFGWSVGISGDVAMVGARGVDDRGGESGAVYVFRRTGTDDGPAWGQVAKLIADDTGFEDRFGWAITLRGDAALISSIHHEAGAAYVFRRVLAADGEAWEQRAKLTAEDGESFDGFGVSLALEGDVAVVGAPRWHSFEWIGAAYVFRRVDGSGPGGEGERWTQQAMLMVPDPMQRQFFGEAVALSGDFVLVGAPGDIQPDGPGGSAHLYRRTETSEGFEWVHVSQVLPAGVDEDDSFGAAAALEGRTALVGADTDDDGGEDAGAAYVGRVPICFADFDDDIHVAFADLLRLLDAWGPCPECPEDLDRSGDVDVEDLDALLAAWGPCP